MPHPRSQHHEMGTRPGTQEKSTLFQGWGKPLPSQHHLHALSQPVGKTQERQDNLMNLQIDQLMQFADDGQALLLVSWTAIEEHGEMYGFRHDR